MSLDPKQPRDGILSDLQDRVRVGLCQRVPPRAKMGPWTDGAILTHKPSLQTSQELDFHVTHSPAAPQQRMLCCQGARARTKKWGLLGHIQCQQHLMPLTKPRVIGAERDNSENGRKHHFPNERETKKLPNQGPLLQGPLQEQRGTEPTLPRLAPLPTHVPANTVTWTVVSTLCIAAELPTATLLGDQTSALSQGESVWPSCKGDQRNEI